MRRQMTNPEREEYRMHYYNYDLYRSLAAKNKKRGGSLAKLQAMPMAKGRPCHATSAQHY